MGSTRIISVIGRKDAGKTTLVVALAAEFNRQGKKVATIKHGRHPAQVDTEGTDSWRHFNEGHAQRALIESPGLRILFQRTEADGDPASIARQYMSDMDLVIVEGFKSSSLPKIEVHRSQMHRQPLFRSDSPDAPLWVAIVTDDPESRFSCPMFRFNDTAWLVTLSGLAWTRARLLDP